MILKLKTKYIDEDVKLESVKYPNGTKAVLGCDPQTYEPILTATVALREIPQEGCVFLKGWSENEGVPEVLRDAGIVEFTGRVIPIGYVEAIEARLLVEI